MMMLAGAGWRWLRHRAIPRRDRKLHARVRLTVQGGDDTFGTFPSHLKALLQHALPKVRTILGEWAQL